MKAYKQGALAPLFLTLRVLKDLCVEMTSNSINHAEVDGLVQKEQNDIRVVWLGKFSNPRLKTDSLILCAEWRLKTFLLFNNVMSYRLTSKKRCISDIFDERAR